MHSLKVVGGNVRLDGASTTTNGDLTFTNAITLIGDSTLTSILGNILLSSTVDGAFDLILNANSIQINGAVGSTTALDTFQIVLGTGNTFNSIRAASIEQLAGTSTFNAMTATTSSGINLKGSSFTLAAM